jgi:ADP-ribosyl-[dinitrogen reductase] hydrolase
VSSPAAPDRRVDRYRGALLGLAVGDAVGTTVEFRPPGTFPPVTDMVGGGPFGLPAGAWTDDTSMALCLADSLLARRGSDPVDQLERYVRWFRDGERSSTGRCFDIGGATRQALVRFERTGEAAPGLAFPDAGGNGGLMRLAPVVLAHAFDRDRAVAEAAVVSDTTHGLPQARDACRLFAATLCDALAGGSRSSVLGDAVPADGLHPEVAAVAAGSFRTTAPPAIRGAGYAVRSLEAALWAVWTTRTFEDAVLAAVNLGDDADTTAAIAGQLAGALYGVDGTEGPGAIPARWRERVLWGDEIEGLADGLLALREELATRG